MFRARDGDLVMEGGLMRRERRKGRSKERGREGKGRIFDKID